MTLEPNTPDEIEDSVEDRLSGDIAKLTNFVSTSFNRVFLSAFSNTLYDYEIRLLAAQLSGWVDYAGGPVTEEDLDDLGLTDFDDLDRLNDYMQDEHLDQIGSLVGVDRSPGNEATGEVTIETFNSTTQIPDGLRVSTPPDVDGNVFIYEVTIDDDFVSPADQGNTNEVTVDVVAEEVGREYNVGVGRVDRFRSPPPGVESVSNPVAIDGGEDEQSNTSLREDIKNAVFESSGGGTVEGIRGYILNNVTGVEDVVINEFFGRDPVEVEVIVDGGPESEVLDAIEQSRPAGIRHILIRPEVREIAVDVEVRGSDINQTFVEDEIERYLFDLELGENFFRNRLIQRILNADDDLENILALNVYVTDVQNEQHEFSTGTDVYSFKANSGGRIEGEDHFFVSGAGIYELNIPPVDDSSVTVTGTSGGTSTTFVQGTDYQIIDNNGDGSLDSVDWTIGGDSPDDQTDFTIDYDVLVSDTDTLTYSTGTDIYSLGHEDVLRDGASVQDNSGDTYTVGTDFEIIDDNGDGDLDAIDWSIGGSSPDDAEDFTVTYDLPTTSITEVTGTFSGVTGTEFVEGADYEELDDNSDGELDAIDWSLAGDEPDDGTDFSMDYSLNRIESDDIAAQGGQKFTADTDRISITVYN